MKRPFNPGPSFLCLLMFTAVFIFPLGQADVTLQSLGVQEDKSKAASSDQSDLPKESPFRGPASVTNNQGPQLTITCVDKNGRIYHKDENGYDDCLEGGGLQNRPSTYHNEGPREVGVGIIIK